MGVVLSTNIIMFGAMSGGHFNPAVTICVFISEGAQKMMNNALFMVMIITSQFAGAALGIVLYQLT